MSKLKDIYLKVVGVTFDNPNGTSRQEAISKVRLDSKIWLRREPENEYDPNAIAVFTEIIELSDRSYGSLEVQLGFLSGEDAQNMAVLMDSGIQFEAVVEQIGIYKGKNYLKILVDEV